MAAVSIDEGQKVEPMPVDIKKKGSLRISSDLLSLCWCELTLIFEERFFNHENDIHDCRCECSLSFLKLS